MNMGKTAPGIVFERLIQGLSKMHTVDILTSALDPAVDLLHVNKIFEIKKVSLHYRILKLLISIFGNNPIDLLWAKKALSQLKKSEYKNYDLIFSFIAFNHYAPLVTGNRIAKKAKVKHAVYSVDAIPAPIGWMKNDLFYKGTKRLISKHLSKVDCLFSANKKMLEYQLTMFKPKKNISAAVIYNPSGDLQYFEYGDSHKNTFLYTGAIYGPRKPHYILEAFKLILIDYPDSTLEFVGGKLSEHDLSIFDNDDKKKVLIHPFVKDLTPYYKRAVALIDIDSVLPNDIFLSSKIANYITINRIIISETGDNSPSREIFKGIPSILQCGHNIDEIACAMRQAIEKRDEVNYDDRTNVISIFNLNSVISQINNVIGV